MSEQAVSEQGEKTVDAGPGAGRTEDSTPAAPVLRVVNPDATPEEIAALVAVFSAMGGEAPKKKRPRPQWAAPVRTARHLTPQGPGGWRASGLPR